VEASGQDAAEAVEALAKLVASGFHVDEGQKAQAKAQSRRHDEHDEKN
jgi:hypothetical protein